jgi:hypothetical protein
MVSGLYGVQEQRAKGPWGEAKRGISVGAINGSMTGLLLAPKITVSSS